MKAYIVKWRFYYDMYETKKMFLNRKLAFKKKEKMLNKYGDALEYIKVETYE